MPVKYFDHWLEGDSCHYLMRDRKPSLPTNLDAHITLNPHYSNPQFDGKGEVEIWGKKQDGLEYVYSDRLWQWDYSKAEKAAQQTKESGVAISTARWVQTYLSYYYEKPVEVCHIYSGVFPHSGYSYWVAGFKFTEAS